MPERLDRMAGEVAPRKVGQRHRQHDRQIAPQRLARLDRGHHPGLGVQCIEHRLDQHEIDPALDQRVDLLAVNILEIIEIDLAIAGIVDVGAERQRLVGRPDRPRDEARAAVLRGKFVRHAPRELGALDIDLAHQMLGGIIGLADAVGGEGIGLGDIRPRLEIGAVDRFGHLGLGQRQDVVIALLIARQPEIAGIVRLGELPALDLGAERAVGDQDALGRLGIERVTYTHDKSSDPLRTARFVIPAKAGIHSGWSIDSSRTPGVNGFPPSRE